MSRGNFLDVHGAPTACVTCGWAGAWCRMVQFLLDSLHHCLAWMYCRSVLEIRYYSLCLESNLMRMVQWCTWNMNYILHKSRRSRVARCAPRGGRGSVLRTDRCTIAP